MPDVPDKLTLFLLQPAFDDGSGGNFFCPDSALIEGFLRYYPEIEAQIDIHRIAFPRPRAAVVDHLGETHQGCPVLVLPIKGLQPPGTQRSEHTGLVFVADGRPICNYLARTFNLARPHHG